MPVPADDQPVPPPDNDDQPSSPDRSASSSPGEGAEEPSAAPGPPGAPAGGEASDESGTGGAAGEGGESPEETESQRRREIRERPQTRRITRNTETRVIVRPDLPDLQALADLSRQARESQLGIPSSSSDRPGSSDAVSETETPPAGTPVVRPPSTDAPPADEPPPGPAEGAETHTEVRAPEPPPPSPAEEEEDEGIPEFESSPDLPAQAEAPPEPAASAAPPATPPAASSPSEAPPLPAEPEQWGDTAEVAFQRSLLGDADFELSPAPTGAAEPPADASPPSPATPAPPSAPEPPAEGRAASSDDFLQRLDQELAQHQVLAHARPQPPAPAEPRPADTRSAPPAAGTRSLLSPPKMPKSEPSSETLASLLLRPITRLFRRPQRSPETALPRQLVLSVQEVVLQDHGRRVLDGVSFDVIPGEAVGIIGRNSSGKSALLKICAGIIQPTSGLVLIDGIDPFHGKYRDRQQARRKIGYVFQDGTLISNIPVYDNIAMPLRYHTPLDEESIARKVDIWLRRLELTDVIAARPGDLPTHRARLVNLARALVGEPHILILDEPFAMLDRHTSDLVIDVIRELKEGGTTVIIASTGGQRVLDVAERFGALEHGHLARIDKAEIRRRGVQSVTDIDVVTPSGRHLKARPVDDAPFDT